MMERMIRINLDGEKPVEITLTGEWRVDERGILLAALMAVIPEGDIRLDLSGCTTLAWSCVAPLIWASREVCLGGHSFSIVGPFAEPVEGALRQHGLWRLVEERQAAA